jgi:multidrug transporter EmrE-like cation transporter
LELRDVTIFWISIGVIVLLGTVGGILFKYGTNNLGQITFDKLLKIEVTMPSILSMTAVMAGIALFFIGGYTLRPSSFAANYIFSPVIFAALVFLALSRILVGIPLSMMGLGRFTAILTAAGVTATAAGSAIVFREELSIRLLIGVGLAAAAVAVLGEEF